MNRSTSRIKSCKGFTIIELTVASVITAVALLAIYTLLHQAVEREKQLTVRWTHSDAATAAVATLANSLEQTLNIVPKIPAISAGRDPEAGQWVCCVTSRVEVGTDDVACPHLVRYSWTTGGDAGLSGSLSVQEIRLAGARCIEAWAGPDDSLSDVDWRRVPPRLVVQGLTDLKVEFLEVGKSARSDWTENWKGPSGKVAVRITARSGDYVARRVVMARANFQAPEQEGSGG